MYYMFVQDQSTSQDIISRVYNGQSLNVIGEENGWFKINHNGKTGFVSGEFVSKKEQLIPM